MILKSIDSNNNNNNNKQHLFLVLKIVCCIYWSILPSSFKCSCHHYCIKSFKISYCWLIYAEIECCGTPSTFILAKKTFYKLGPTASSFSVCLPRLLLKEIQNRDRRERNELNVLRIEKLKKREKEKKEICWMYGKPPSWVHKSTTPKSRALSGRSEPLMAPYK